MRSRLPQSGFTLVEVLVALAVVAIALLALTRAASVQVQSFDGLRERTLAGWVGANVLSETRLTTPFPPTGKSDGRMQLAGRDWRWTRDVQATQAAEIRRIDVIVYLGESHEPSATLSGFAGTALP
jgi:general secretion pathway protein I